MTTTLDALWMGVPVVTLAGSTPVSRGGVSILSNIGMTQWIARSREEYVRIATDLASDRHELALHRRTLRERMIASPLMNEREFMGDLEGVLRNMAGMASDHLLSAL